jgi:hypothetical protein
MSTELICPDCGGVIGADVSDAGRACMCFADKSASTERITPSGPTASIEPLPTADALADADTNDDTFVERTEEAPKPKVCCQCGKDLSGHRRLRDSRGYWCYACHKLDKEANKPKGEKCPECSRVVAESAMGDFEGRRVCGKCREELKEKAKEQRRLSPVKTDAHEELAKHRLFWIMGIAAVLVLIIILKTFKIIGT